MYFLSLKPGSDGRQESLSRRGDTTSSYSPKIKSSCELDVALSLSPKSSYSCHVFRVFCCDATRNSSLVWIAYSSKFDWQLQNCDKKFGDKDIKIFWYSCRCFSCRLLFWFFLSIEILIFLNTHGHFHWNESAPATLVNLHVSEEKNEDKNYVVSHFCLSRSSTTSNS